MKQRILFIEDRSERLPSLLSAAAEAGWEASVSQYPNKAMEASRALSIDIVFVSVSNRDFQDGPHAVSLLAGATPGNGPAVILAAPAEIADDIRPIASALGIWAVFPECATGKDAHGLCQLLQRFCPGLVSAKADGEASSAALVSTALRLSGLRREASLGSRRAEAVLRIANMAARQVPIEELAPELLSLAVPLTGSRSGWVSLRSMATPGGLVTVTEPPDLDREALNLALSLIQETTCLDTQELRGESTLWASVGFSRILVCPLASGTSGWLGVADAELPFDPGDRAFLDSLATVLLLHSRNSSAFQQARIATEESKALFKAATLILPYEEPQVVSRQVAQTVASVLGYRHCAVLLPNPDGIRLDLAGASGNLERIHASLALDGLGLTVQAFRTGRMVYCPDTVQSPMYVAGWSECRTELAIPLVHRNEILGVLDLQSDREHAFQGKDLRVLEAFAQRVGTLLYAARQYQSLNAAKERYENLCDGAPMGLFTWNMNTGRINQASAVLKSWVGEDLEGRLVDTILAPTSREVWRRWCARDTKEHTPLSVPVQIGDSQDIPPIDCLLTAYPGRGQLQIPGHAVLLAQTAEARSPVSGQSEDLPPAAGATVILGDPDPVWCSVTRLMLEDWGYAVPTASGAEEMEEILADPQNAEASLLIIDQSLMELGNGSALGKWVRGRSPKPFLVLGGAEIKGLPAGKVRSLAKPYRMKELREALAELLSSSTNAS
jgi:DNA-binding response OmpR family regulator